MGHDLRGRARTRAPRWMRLTAPVGFLLACALLAGLPAAAWATSPNYDMRGEWALEITAKPPTRNGSVVAVINNFEPTSGEYSGPATFEGQIPASISGITSGDNASISMTATIPGDGTITFTAPDAVIEPVANTMTGAGAYFKEGKEFETGTVIGRRIKTYTEVQEREEREAKEKQEREEAEARENIRGEWSLTLKAGPQTSNGTALITAAANTKNEFASSAALFEAVVPGSFTGTLEGANATVTVTTEAFGSIPASKFTSSTIKVESKDGSMSMSGEGTLTVGTTEIPGATVTAIRTKTYKEVTERLAKEKLEAEAKEKLEREAEARQKLEAEAKEKLEREAKEKLEREAREAAAKAAAVKVTQPVGGSSGATPALVSVKLTGKTFSVGSSELVSLQVTNPNPYAISGRITLLVAGSGGTGKSSASKGGATSKNTASLGTVSFGISSKGAQLVKLKLSHRARTELTHHAILRAIVSITTRAAGQTSTTETLSITLHAAKPARAKH